MTSYLLLRNNKESGPFSLDEIRVFGLKAYDLIWVNGKSAAWRYPGEIEELKPFAPAVVEQPFDRFFKKPGEEIKEDVAIPKPVPTSAPEENKIHEQPQAVVPPSLSSRSVFVTMPARPVIEEKVIPPAASPIREEHATYLPKTNPVIPPTRPETPVASQPVISIQETPRAEIKYSQPLDEIKEMYVKTLQDRKRRIANKTFLLQAGKKAAVLLLIVGAGVLIGMRIKSGPGKENTLALQTLPITTLQATAENNSSKTDEAQDPMGNASLVNQPVDASIDPIENKGQPVSKPQQPVTSRQPRETIVVQPSESKRIQEKTTVVPEQAPAPVKKEPARETPAIKGDEQIPTLEVDNSTGERSRKIRTGDNSTDPVNTATKTPARAVSPRTIDNALSKLVSVKSNDYTIVAFGGIRNLQLTVSNDSKYVIDNVLVELNYLKPNDIPLRTETIPFRSIAPGGTQTIRIPDTNRGIKVNYRIVQVLSTQSSKEMADL